MNRGPDPDTLTRSPEDCEHLTYPRYRYRDMFGSYCGECGTQLGWSGISIISDEAAAKWEVRKRIKDRQALLDSLRPGITVCIACHPARYNNQLVNRAFNSVTKQTLQPEAIIIVNDRDKRGAGWTRRQLLSMVDTQWIAWIDSDDEWLPDHLAHLFQVATETDSVYVYSWFHGADPLGHFGLPFNPCTPHHTTMNVLVRTDLAKEVGFPDNQVGPHANEDWAFITGVAALCCKDDLKMTHLAEKTWYYHQGHGNTSGQPNQGDARGR